MADPEKSMEFREKSKASLSSANSSQDSNLDAIEEADITRIQTAATTKSVKPTILEKITTRLTLTRSTVPDPLPPPNGGLVAWTHCFLTFLVMMCTWGAVNSFGAFQTYYTSTLGIPQSTISWIGSVQAFLQFFLAIFTGRALDAGLFRPVVIAGVIIQVLGWFLMSISTKYWQLFLTQGIMIGVGGGLYFCPSMGLLSTYFSTRRGIATGLATTGNAIGGIIFPVIVQQLIGKVGFAWTTRVIGFVILVLLVIVVAFSKPRLPPRKSGAIIDRTAIRDVPYLLFIFGVFVLMLGIYFVYYYIGSFARHTIGMSYTDSLNLVIILNGAGFPARILPGLAADRWGALNVFIPLLICNIILLYSWIAVKELTGFYVFTVIFGMAGASFQSMFPVAITSLNTDITKTGTRLGMAFSVISFAALFGGPIGGALLTTDDGGYLPSQLYAATAMLFGCCMCFGARTYKFGLFYRGKC